MHSPWQPPLPELQSRIQSLTLSRGQICLVWQAAGSQLLCQAPSIQVTESPQWQVERLTSRRTRLADGERMVLEQAGWIEIHAAQGGQLLCLAPPRRLWQVLLTSWWQRLRLLTRLSARQEPRATGQ